MCKEKENYYEKAAEKTYFQSLGWCRGVWDGKSLQQEAELQSPGFQKQNSAGEKEGAKIDPRGRFLKEKNTPTCFHPSILRKAV